MVSTEFVWALLALVGLLVAAGVCLRLLTRITRVGNAEDRRVAAYGRRVVVAIIVVVLVAFGVGLWPYQWEYHSYRSVAGTVEAIDTRLMADGNVTTQAYAIRLTTGKTYRCDDTRCASVRKGDAVALRCIRQWEYAAEDGYRCRFVRYVPANR